VEPSAGERGRFGKLSPDGCAAVCATSLDERAVAACLISPSCSAWMVVVDMPRSHRLRVGDVSFWLPFISLWSSPTSGELTAASGGLWRPYFSSSSSAVSKTIAVLVCIAFKLSIKIDRLGASGA